MKFFIVFIVELWFFATLEPVLLDWEFSDGNGVQICCSGVHCLRARAFP
jgi:hypothetical protein